MANNTVLNPGALGDTIATEDIAGVKHELVKLEFGAVGVATRVSTADPLPVTDAIAEAALVSIAAEDFATQVTLAAVLLKLSSDPATQTTLAAILVKLITNPSTDTLQTTGNTTLASILAKIIAAPSTEAKQDIIITALNSIDAGTAAALGQALMAASVPVVIASNQSAIPVSGTVAVTGAGDASAANQTTEITSLASLVTAMTTLTGAINSAAQEKISIENMAMMCKRMMQMLERPPYMNSIGNVRVDLAANTFGTLTITGSLTALTGLGAGTIDQTFTYFTQNRDTFNGWKNNIIN